MSARRTISSIVLVALTSLILFFNNCAQKADETSASTEVATATDISGPILSGIRLTTLDGKVQGWAMDKGKPSSILRVYFYLNGPAGTGTYLGEAIANVRQPGTYEGHYFTFQISQDLLDGKPHPLYIYAHKAVEENFIYPAPYSVVGYKLEVPEFYSQNVQKFIDSNNCVRCHQQAWTAETLFQSLVNPYPISGGSPTNNKFYRKMSGAEGHNGGTFCNMAGNANFCPSIEAWWRAEFQ